MIWRAFSACAAFSALAAVSSVALAPAPGHDELASAPEHELTAPTALVSEPLDASQQRLVKHLSRRFRVAAESTEEVVLTAYSAAARSGLDPLLVLAMIAIESRFNPLAESPYGAKGLMQIIPKYHRDKLAAHGGEAAALDPEANILVGTQILQEYVRRTGTLEGGLQYYVGSLSDSSAQYAQKVLAERERLEGVLRSKGTLAKGT